MYLLVASAYEPDHITTPSPPPPTVGVEPTNRNTPKHAVPQRRITSPHARGLYLDGIEGIRYTQTNQTTDITGHRILIRFTRQPATKNTEQTAIQSCVQAG